MLYMKRCVDLNTGLLMRFCSLQNNMQLSCMKKSSILCVLSPRACYFIVDILQPLHPVDVSCWVSNTRLLHFYNSFFISSILFFNAMIDFKNARRIEEMKNEL
jgi:hypothetical protein